MANVSKFTSTFEFDKETSGAFRFQEIDNKGNRIRAADGAKIGTLYLRKDALNGSQPSKVSVDVKLTY